MLINQCSFFFSNAVGEDLEKRASQLNTEKERKEKKTLPVVMLSNSFDVYILKGGSKKKIGKPLLTPNIKLTS